jgi:hypothetical protein
MAHEQKRFGYNLVFCEQSKGQNAAWKYFGSFAAADTAEEAIENLAKILSGSTSLKQQFEEGSNAILTKFELESDGKKLLSFNVGLGDPGKMAWLFLGHGGMLGDPWKRIVFDNVNRDLLDALVKNFPAQKQFFKGKALEESLGL